MNIALLAFVLALTICQLWTYFLTVFNYSISLQLSSMLYLVAWSKRSRTKKLGWSIFYNSSDSLEIHVSISTFASVIAELIIGYTLPGRPVAMMLFKTWGYITMTQGLCSYSPCSAQLTIVCSTYLLFRFQAWTVGHITDSEIGILTFAFLSYMKIPPRTMFFAQVGHSKFVNIVVLHWPFIIKVLCAAIACTVQLGVQAWMFTYIE